MGFTSEDQNLKYVNERWTKIALIAIVTDIFNLLGVGLGVVLLALVLTDYYRLFTKHDYPNFVRFDMSIPDDPIIEKPEFKPIKDRTYWLIVVLLGVVLFVLRFAIFTILGKEL